ncbi:hypothetical protein ILYODFUR_035228 [Ilyodon furcidens]|uniref:Uncharacterized protein n=1 Tax=Ilyodon furcidens TaxID=33524 RepID=A0ABV0SSK4_9TELE
MQVVQAEGWQVKPFYDPLISFKPHPKEGRPAPYRQATQDQDSVVLIAQSSAPPLYEGLCGPKGWGHLNDGLDGGPTDLLTASIRESWPYHPASGQVSRSPLTTTQHPLVFRVYRDQGYEDVGTALEQPPDNEEQQAQPSGWFGPWELTTWGQLILEVVANPDLPLEDLPDTPKERGARCTRLNYFTTSLDAWGRNGARPKQKVGEFIVTSKTWHRNRLLQIPGTVAHWIDTPTGPGSTQKVELAMQMVVIPFRGVYSVGATITVIPEQQKVDPRKGEVAAAYWNKRSHSWPWPSLPQKWKWTRKDIN